MDEQFLEDGRWRGKSDYTADVEKRFEDLLKNQTLAGDEALGYLLYLYIGEHPGEKLICEIINRGKRMLPIIRAYEECLPKTGLEPFSKLIQGSGFLPGMAIKGISKGEKCSFED